MSTQAPPSTPSANEVRLANAARRARVAAPRSTAVGMAQLAVEFESQPRWPKWLRVEEILRWPYRSQPRQRAAIRRHVGLSESRTVQTLTSRQLGVLCHALRSPAMWRGRA